MQPMPTRVLLALTLAALAAPALAQTPPSADEARSLEQQIHDVLAAAANPALTIPARPVELTPDGDHYAVRLPFGAFATAAPSDDAMTAQAHRLDSARWSIDDIRLPPAFRLAETVAVPASPDAAGAPGGQVHPGAVTYDIKLGQQAGHAVFDPTATSPSSSQGVADDVDIVRGGALGASHTHFASVATQASVRPLGVGRLDLQTEATVNGYALQSQRAEGAAFNLTASTVHVVAGLSGLAQERLLPVLHVLLQIQITGRDQASQRVEAYGHMHQLLVAATDLLRGMRVDETLTDLRFDAGGYSGSLAHLTAAIDVAAPHDMVAATMTVAGDGLVVDGLPPAIAAYIPNRFSIRPTMSNLSAADLTTMAMHATTPHSTGVLPADAQALFMHDGINLGFDSFLLDISGAQFSGSGKFVLSGPQTLDGQAEITAQGLDTLIATALGNPLFPAVGPGLIFLKGIARVNGDQAVWQLTVADNKLLVNGVDLSALGGAR